MFNFRSILEQIISAIAVLGIIAFLTWVRKLCRDVNIAFSKIRTHDKKIAELEEKLNERKNI